MRPWTSIPALRLAVGAAQGLVLLFLTRTAGEVKVWPYTEPYVFVPLIHVSFFLPLVVIAGLGNMPVRALLRWAGGVAVLIAALALYMTSKFRMEWVDTFQSTFYVTSTEVWLSFFLSLTAGLFIAQTLAVAASQAGHRIAPYPSYFDLAWKHGVQLVSAALFAVAFWIMMTLGHALFELIGITVIGDIATQDWFAIPATALITATALHIADIRPSIVVGVRTLALNLLSWLLPLLTLIVWGFLASLPFTGLETLWAMNSATALLLAIAAALIILINAVYQDGQGDKPPRPLRFAASAAALGLTPISAIAAYGLFLRVAQYGWTTQRVIAAACVAVALGYALGYGWAAVRRGPWLALLGRWNVVMSFAVLGVLFALFTPVADPHRISVASQVERLKSGRADVDTFDYDYLRFDAGRHGLAALEELKGLEARFPGIAQRVDLAMAKTAKHEIPQTPSAERIRKNVRVVTPERALPETFAQQDWTGAGANHIWPLPACMTGNEICDAMMIDLNGDLADEIVVLPQPQDQAQAFAREADGLWRMIGTFPWPACAEARDAIRAGEVGVALPAWQDLIIAGQRFRFSPPSSAAECPPPQ